MTESTDAPRKGPNPLLRYIPLTAMLVLLWPLAGQSVEVFGFEMSASIVGAVLAVLGTAFGTLASRGR